MIPDGSREPSHVKLLLKMLTLFFEAEQEESKDRYNRDDRSKINDEVRLSFTKRFAQYLFCLRDSKLADYIEKLRIGCEIASIFVDYLILCVAVEAEKKGEKEFYWQLWKELSQKIQKIAIDEVAGNDSNYRQRDEKRKLIRTMLQADLDWQTIDYKSQDIVLGKDLLLEFVTNAGKNIDVFESLASLMYHFPSIFFESGVHILSKHQKDGGPRLLSRGNTVFYLERAIQRFLQLDETGPLPRTMHESCFVLLNAIVETASSRAYYLREHLIRSRKIL